MSNGDDVRPHDPQKGRSWREPHAFEQATREASWDLVARRFETLINF